MGSILIINPNSSASITEGLAKILKPAEGIKYTFFTGPSSFNSSLPATTIEYPDPNNHSISVYQYKTSHEDLHSPPMIDNSTTSVLSAASCLPHITQDLIDAHDGFVVGCFSDHPLVNLLREKVGPTKPVVGIFQASVLTSLAFGAKFAIVTTAKIWERLLDNAVLNLLGSTFHYAGTYSTGLTVLECHDLPEEQVAERLVQKAKEAVENGATSIILGCAGLSGLDEKIREAVGKEIAIVDSVICATETVTGIIRNKKAFYGV